MDKFLERLEELINEKGITYEQLAINTGIGLSAVYAWTGKRNMPKLDKLFIISNYFKCSIEYLLGRTDDNTELPPKEYKPFDGQLLKILKSKGLKRSHLRNNLIISRGLDESIFINHSTPFIYNVIKIADYFKISVDELVGRV